MGRVVLLIHPQPRNLPPLGEFFEQRNQFVHQRQFGLGVGFSAQFLRGEQVAELVAVEHHAAQDGFYKGLQGGGIQRVPDGDVGQGFGVFVGLEAFKPGAYPLTDRNALHG